MIKLVLGLMLLTQARAYAASEFDESEYLEHAIPLVESFLRDKSAEYGVDLSIDSASWRVKHVFPENYFPSTRVAAPFRVISPAELVEYSCREVTVDLPTRGARAHFFVAQAIPRREPRAERTEYVLVGSCSTNPTLAPAMTLEVLSPRSRTFDTRELIMRSTPLIVNLLKLNGETTPLTRGSVKVKKDWRWLYEWAFERNRDCRTLKFRVGSRVGRVRVAISYDEPNISTSIPVEVQSLLKDPVSLRTFRFALVHGCSDAEADRAPELTLVSGAPDEPAADATH